MKAQMPAPVLTADALVKRAALAALVGLIVAYVFSPLTAALIAVAVLYALLIVRNAAG